MVEIRAHHDDENVSVEVSGKPPLITEEDYWVQVQECAVQVLLSVGAVLADNQQDAERAIDRMAELAKKEIPRMAETGIFLAGDDSNV